MPPIATQQCLLAPVLAKQLRASREELVRRWLDRITARTTINPQRIFPSDELLNHVPLLVDGIASYLEHPDRELGSDAPVVAKAMELGGLRHSQGFDAYEILKEHEILGGVVFNFLATAVEELEPEVSARDLVTCWQRVAQAIELIRQATMTHFLRLWADRTQEREERLRRFNRMVSHELKNRVAAIRGASSLLKEEWLAPKEREEFVRMVSENAVGLQQVLEDLEALSRIDVDLRQRRNVLLPQAASRLPPLREPARAGGERAHRGRSAAGGSRCGGRGDGTRELSVECDQVLGPEQERALGRRVGGASLRHAERAGWRVDRDGARQWPGGARERPPTAVRAFLPRTRALGHGHRGVRAGAQHRARDGRGDGRPRVGRVPTQWRNGVRVRTALASFG